MTPSPPVPGTAGCLERDDRIVSSETARIQKWDSRRESLSNQPRPPKLLCVAPRSLKVNVSNRRTWMREAGGRMPAPRTEHLGERPEWDCRVCGQPWPCAAAKVELGEQYQRNPAALNVFLGSCMLAAIDDCAAGQGGPPADLFERFLGWYARL
jgi:hypothetical protein